MWLILAGLLILIAWAVWFVFSIHIWIPITVTVVLGIGVGTLYLVRFILARTAASKLEKAIAAQGAQQAMNARPERRAEIQELQKQLQGGINALKTSKLGRGGKSGAAALYSMPWYMIIGPPGAGKTTALKHSGLVFPYGSSSGGGVRGVGGTRNCDWWFTNEAILLDTAGRYTTENDDRDEWLSFLQFLLKYRAKRPINGILVAISIADLIDASDQQIEVIGKKLRARIDEVMTQLHMVLPVYFLFTKVDLIAGFNEFFSDLRKSDRAQAWGTTLKLDIPKNEPGKLFDAEFDILLKSLHGRALKRMAIERSREARERVYQFPLEFAGVKRNLSDLVASTFAVNAFQGTPIFRGFYFTSGTQEGRPLDRVLGRMGQAMGIRLEGQQQQQVVESKSYFLHDVFMNIVFPDGDLAARSASELRRRLVMRAAISAAALTLAAILALPSINSFLNNRAFLRETEARAKKTSSIDWSDGKPPSAKFPLLKPSLERLKDLDGYRASVPVGMGWMMYSGDKVARPTLGVYVASLQKGFVVPAKQKIETDLKKVDKTASKYLYARNLLKMYLMLNDTEHLDVDWATGKFTAYWVSILKATSDISDSELRELVRPHVAYYFQLLKEKRVSPLPLDTDLVEATRTTLQGVPVDARYYALFIDSLMDEKYDDAGDNARENLVFPPVSLVTLFPDKPEVLKIVESNLFKTKQLYQEVDGPYTEKGHALVVKNLEAGADFLQDEAWVIPLTREESTDQIAVHIKNVADAYETKYIQEWTDLFEDLRAKSPTSAEEALDIWRILSTTEYPYRRLIFKLEDHTQWKNANPLEGKDGVTRVLNQRLNQTISTRTRGLRFGLDVSQLSKERSSIPSKFRSMCSFGTATQDTGVQKYAELLLGLRSKMVELRNSNASADIRQLNEEIGKAQKDATQILSHYDNQAQKLLGPLLMNPITIGSRENNTPKTTTSAIPPGQLPPTGKKPTDWTMPKIPGRP